MTKEDWHIDLEAELRGSNHRSLLVVLTAQMEETLRELLSMHSEVKTKSGDSFAQLISKAEKHSIVDTDVAGILTTYRKVRNVAAHQSTAFSLEDSNHRLSFSEVRTLIPNIQIDDDSVREVVLMCGVNVVAAIRNSIANKLLQENQWGSPYESKIWLQDDILMNHAFPKGTRP